jgi:formiminotetrahydrofolate cyclodeaminase
VAAQAQALCDRVTPLADIDAKAYEAARVAQKLGYDNFELGRAFATAAEPPIQIVETATDVALLSVVVARGGDPSLRPDATAAAALAVGAAQAAAELVAANLTASATDERVLRVRALVAEAAEAAEHALAER